ncbi:MAG TPA: histidine phosphatase family protein [Phenylobacterium sp.]|jgi:probable phosphoglycerate mutase|nr:histidine phosphatase family protein [Phenylobacterium sp.]
MELVLVRHGLPERTDATADPPLTPEGHDQAARVARWLEPDGIQATYSSTMLRAVQTAEPFIALTGHALAQHDGIVEFDRGSGAYVPMEVLKREDYAAWKAMADGSHDIDIDAFQKMVVTALEEIIVANPGRKVAVFCHGGVVNVWTAHVLGMAPRLFFEPGYTSVHRYMCASTGQRNVVSLNERAHLR